MKIHLVIEDDQGETFKIQKDEADRYRLLYCPITEDVEEPVTDLGLIERINFALREGLNIEIANSDNPETIEFVNYRISYLTPEIFEKMKKNLKTHNVSIRKSNLD